MATKAKSLSGREKPRLRWYQYRLRSLLLLMLFVNLGMSCVAVKMKAAHEQEALVARIKKLGGRVAYDYQSFLGDTTSRPLAPAWLRRLFGDDMFVNVTCVDLGMSEADEAVLWSLDGLYRLPRLEFLGLGAAVSDRGLKHLADSTQLQSLSLFGARVRGPGVRHLKGLGQLRSLILNDSEINDTGFESIKELPQLWVLFLENTKIGDEGLKHLAGMGQLRCVNLDGTRVTDAGLVHLESLTSLCEVHLSRTAVTDAGVKRLQRALPEAKIVR